MVGGLSIKCSTFCKENFGRDCPIELCLVVIKKIHRSSIRYAEKTFDSCLACNGIPAFPVLIDKGGVESTKTNQRLRTLMRQERRDNLELRILRRKIWRLVLSAVFLLLILLSIFLFAIQSVLDAIGMEYAVECYASVGTVYRLGAENAAFAPIEQDVLTLLSQTDTVQEMDIRQTLSAKITGMENVPCYFAVPQTNHLVFFRGTVLSQMEMPTDENASYHAQYTKVRVDTIYAGQSNWITKGNNVDVAMIWNGEQVCKTIVGEEYYFFAQSSFSNSLGLLDTVLYAYNYTQDYVAEYELLQSNYELYHDTVIAIPDGLDEKSADAYGLDILKSRHLDQYIEEIKKLDDIFTVRQTTDMQMLIPVANETMFFTEGRGIRPDDANKRVCVISYELAKLQKINVGDCIAISLGDSCYHDNGYESGFPAFCKCTTS